MEISATVQNLFLPEQSFFESERVRLSGYFRAANQCGGDWWWYSQEGEQTFRIFLGDVTGHGAGPAMITAAIATSFKIFREDRNKSFDEVMALVNRQLFDVSQNKYWMTACAIELNTVTLKMKYFCMGHLSPYLIRNDGNMEMLEMGGKPLGNESFEPVIQEIQLNPGDRLFALTDGIIEAENSIGKSYGKRKLGKLLMETRAVPIDKARQMVIEDVDKFRGEAPQGDDFSYVIFEAVRTETT